MRNTALLLSLTLAATAAAQVLPPSWGIVEHSGNRAVEIQGLPGSWLAVAALEGRVDAVASSPRQICWTRDGTLYIRDRSSGETRSRAVPAGAARFAFDRQDALAAVWFAATGELYTTGSGWNPVFSLPAATSQVLDLAVHDPGSVLLLVRAASGRRASAEAVSNRSGARIAVPGRSGGPPDLERLTVDSLTGRTLARASHMDRSGPAALDAEGGVVFGADAGLPAVDSMQHLDRGWLLLTAASRQYAWRPGMRPQATSDTTAPPLIIQATPAQTAPAPAVCGQNSHWTMCTINLPDTPATSVYSSQAYELVDTSQSNVCIASVSGFLDPATVALDSGTGHIDTSKGQLDDFFKDFIVEIDETKPPDPSKPPETRRKTIIFTYPPDGLHPLPGLNAVELPISFLPQSQTKYSAVLIIGYYLLSGTTVPNSCPALLPADATATPGTLVITVNGTGTPPPAGPWLTSIDPTSNLVGAPSFPLKVSGGNFEADSKVQWQVKYSDGTSTTTNLDTTPVDANNMTATVPATLLNAMAAEAHVTILVSNPQGGTFPGGTQTGVPFAVLCPTPPDLQPSLHLDNLSPLSKAEVKVSVTFDQKALACDITGGLLKLDYTPEPGLQDDGFIMLEGNPKTQDTRAQPFTVPVGSNTAIFFGTQDSVYLNTGTTAGTFTLKAALGDKSDTWGPYRIAPAAPVISTDPAPTLSIAANSVAITLLGFDNSRATSGLTFEFHTKDGAVVKPGPITAGASDIAQFGRLYRDHTELAGQFQVTATFPVTGDVTAIGKAVVTLSNPSGVTTATVPAH